MLRAKENKKRKIREKMNDGYDDGGYEPDNHLNEDDYEDGEKQDREPYQDSQEYLREMYDDAN